ncbi:MAG: MFS transporter, partial [Chloroflexi bacterium]|nr:MFS transporter [Chloroflexota bacterium]
AHASAPAPATAEPSQATPAEPERHPYRWVIIGQIWLHQMLAQVTMVGMGIMLLGIGAELEFGTAEAGWLGATRTVGQLVVFPASFLAVRFAPKRLYGVLTAILGLMMLLGGLAPAFWALFVTQVVFSLAMALAQVPGSLLRTQWIPSRELGRIWGTGNALNAVAQTAALIGIPIALGILGGWRGVFHAAGIAMLLAAVAWMITGRQRGEPRAAGPESNFSALRRPEYYLLGLAALGGATAYLACLLFLPTFLVEERGLSLQTAGFVSAVFPAAGLVSNVASGFISDRVGRRKVFIWPAGLILPFLYVLTVAPLPVALLVPVVFLLGFFAWLPFPSIASIAYELPGVRPAEIAVGQALQQAIAGAGILCGPIIVGQVAALSGSLRLGIIVIGLLPILFTIACVWLPDTGPKAHARPSRSPIA